MPLHIPTLGERVTEEDIWDYATRILTDPDSYKADVSTLALQAALLSTYDRLTDVLEDVSGIAGAVMRGTNDALLTAHFNDLESELGFPSTPENTTLADDGDLAEEEIVVEVPEGAIITRASLICILEAIQNSTTAQVINVVVSMKKAAEAYGAVLTLSPALHLPVYEGTTSEIIMPVDVSDVIDEAATYTLKMAIDQVAASVKYISAYVIIVGYTMG